MVSVVLQHELILFPFLKGKKERDKSTIVKQIGLCPSLFYKRLSQHIYCPTIVFDFFN